MGNMSINSDDLKYGIECCIKYMACSPAEECCDLCPYHGRCSSLEKDALVLIQQLEAQAPKWISVHEALPGMDKSVLFHPMCNEKSIYIGQFSYVGKSGAVYFAVRSGKRKVTYSATHWMPLLEPPEEETAHV